MKKFRKKPVIVEAIQYHGNKFDKVIKAFPEASGWKAWLHEDARWRLDIPTLEGVMTANPGDWIIRGVLGEFYPCKPEAFELSYEHIGE